MSISIVSAAALSFAAQFGQAGFPSQQDVEACVMPTLTVLVTVMAADDPEMKPVEDMFVTAYAKYTAWDLYYDGRRFDDEDFKKVSGELTTQLAPQALQNAKALNDAEEGEMQAMVKQAFACAEAAKPHGLIFNSDGTGGGV